MTEFLSILSEALTATAWIAGTAAFGWGFASIWMSPCHLAGVPLVVGYLTEAPNTADRYHRGTIILSFALGTLLSLVPLGVMTLLLGRVAGDLGISSNYLVALLCTFAGFYLLDWLPVNWPARGLPDLKARGPWAALALGSIFGLALGPCAFAWIAPLLGVAWMQAAEGLALPLLLLALFSVGHCIGVLLAANALGWVQRWLDTLSGNSRWSHGRTISGLSLLAASLYLVVDGAWS